MKSALLVFILLFWFHTSEALEFRLFSASNGCGLQTDSQVLKEALESFGHHVEVCHLYQLPSPADSKIDVNIFFQQLNFHWYALAARNWFISNPEWLFDSDVQQFYGIDLMLCRTLHAQSIFQALGKETYYLGFTSPDCFQAEISKDYTHLFHLAGGSISKGTSAVLSAWNQDKNLPLLTMIKHTEPHPMSGAHLHVIEQRIPDDELRFLQNKCGIHLCPSEAEGFGHYIVEAMAAGAVIITTDAPPMNEFITDKRCLVPFHKMAPFRFAVNYYVDPEALLKQVKQIAALPREELEEMGRQNRAAYFQMKQDFYNRLDVLVRKTIEEKK